MEEKTKITSYTDMNVWREGRKLASIIYQITKSFPKEELFGITNQMRRAAVSVPSNIAEGFGRATAKEKNQFYYVAKGSLAELETQLHIAGDIKYMDELPLQQTLKQCETVHKLLQGLIKANRRRL